MTRLYRGMRVVQVVCWELLTEKHFYSVMMSPDDVIAALNGDAPLPSETPLDDAVDRSALTCPHTTNPQPAAA